MGDHPIREPEPTGEGDAELVGLGKLLVDVLQASDEEVQSVGRPPMHEFGRFELLSVIGRGGMGVVYEARDRSLSGKTVALKVLEGRLESKSSFRRFTAEIEANRKLDHPGIASILNWGEEEGRSFFTMKLVRGVSLERLVPCLRDRASPPSLEDVFRCTGATPADAEREGFDAGPGKAYARWVAEIGLQVAEALEHSHSLEIVHRDVKPANIVLEQGRRPVLVDFGLASEEREEALTRSGGFVGTPKYAAPEQVLHEVVGPRADVYSLGATLYELLALRPPFEEATEGQLELAIRHDDPRRLPRWVPWKLRVICAVALAKSPRQRYASAARMAADLQAFLQGRPIAGRPPGLLHRTAMWVRRRPRSSTAVGLGLFACAALFLREAQLVQARVRDGLAGLETSRGLCEEARARYAELRHVLGPDAEQAVDYRQVELLRAEILGSKEQVDRDHDAAEARIRSAYAYVGGSRAARSALAELQAERLRHALEFQRDLYDVESMARLDTALAEVDDGSHAWLHDPRGSMVLDSVPSGARVRIRRDPAVGPWHADVEGGRGFEHLAVTPLELAEISEGSYLAELEAEGFEPLTFPFRVRRAACYRLDPGAMPPPAATVRLVPAGTIEAGFVHVPEGWTLVEDDPPIWEHVPSFQIQEREVTNAQWIGWMERAASSGRHPDFGPVETLTFRPRLPQDSARSGMLRTAAGWEPIGARGDWPVRALPHMEMSLREGLRVFEPEEEDPFVYSLPRRSEWIRAGRGADARRFPWGDTFQPDMCATALAKGEADPDLNPFPVQSFPRDCSMFGVWDLAGSIAEATVTRSGLERDRFFVCGGSYRSWRPDELGLLAYREEPDEARADVGVRLVRRALPENLQRHVRSLPHLDEDFDGPASLADRGWSVFLGGAGDIFHGGFANERAWIEEGRLICVAEGGDYSKVTNVIRRVSTSPRGFVLSGTLSATREMNGGRDFGLNLVTSFSTGYTRVHLSLAFDRRPGMRVWKTQVLDPLDLDPSEPHRFELRIDGTRAEGRIWPVDAERPVDPMLVDTGENPLPAFYFLQIQAPNYVGSRVVIDQVTLAELD